MHLRVHFAQSRQAAPFWTMALPPLIVKTPYGQIRTQRPHPVQAPASMTTSVRRTRLWLVTMAAAPRTLTAARKPLRVERRPAPPAP